MRVLLAVWIVGLHAAAQTPALNVSRDLTALRIADRNMTPDSPALDSRPLLESAVQYAQSHAIQTITADRGSYYFLTGHAIGRFFSLQSIQNLTLDFNYSDLYFASGNWIGMECDGCSNVRFRNFTVDFLQLPFTQVRVTGVDATANRVTYASVEGWENATNFNQIRNPFSAPEPLYAFGFRNGVPLKMGRLAVKRPFDTASFAVTGDVSALQNGDIVAISARAGGPALAARDGVNITIQNVSVYSSGGAGVLLTSCVNSTADQVQVIPRPGTARLISSNGEGISAAQLGHDLSIRRSRLRRTGGDGISASSQSLASVTGVALPRQVAVNRFPNATVPNGTLVQFIDNKTGFPALTARIVSQTPQFNPLFAALGYPATLTLDQDVPPLAPNAPVVYAEPAFRGAGLIIENNLVEDALDGNGISLRGLLDGTVQSNSLRNLAGSGIVALEQNASGGPIANVTITRNMVERTFGGYGIGIEADDLNLAALPGTPLRNMIVRDNLVSGGPSSGIHISNVDGATVTGNTTMNLSNDPSKPALAVLASTGVNTDGNLADTTTPPALIASAVSGSDDAIAPNSWAKITGANLAPKTDLATTDPLPMIFDDVSVIITDRAGAYHMAPILFISPRQINFLVPSDCPLGAGVVTVTVSGATVARGGILVDSLAPALFTVDGSGSGTALGAALAAHTDGSVSSTPLTQPIDLSDPATLVLFATGIRGRSALENVTVFFNGERMPVQFAGDQGSYAGLDQINIPMDAKWRGAGMVRVRVVVDGLSSNTVEIHVN